MSKFSGRRNGRGFGRGGVVPVIDIRVHNSFARNARLGFWVATVVVAILTATVVADRVHPILALFIGAATGLVAGAVTWAAIRIWPVVRLLWWWTPEILLATVVVYGFTALARHAILPLRLAVVVIVVGVPAAIPAVRRRIVALAWCLIVRHRLRTCFAQFIIANRSGTLPFILAAQPTKVGERVGVYLRTGLSLAYLQANLEKIAVACHAREVTVEAVPDRNAARVQVDIKRRQVLTDQVDSPLIDEVDEIDPDMLAQLRPVSDIPTALDLPDVADPQSAETGKPTLRKPARPVPLNPVPAPVPAVMVRGADGEDVSDWVD